MDQPGSRWRSKPPQAAWSQARGTVLLELGSSYGLEVRACNFKRNLPTWNYTTFLKKVPKSYN